MSVRGILWSRPLKRGNIGRNTRVILVLGLFAFAGGVPAAAQDNAMTESKDRPVADSGSASVDEKRLREHVSWLAGEIGERNVFKPEKLAAAAAYIEKQWRTQGYEVKTQKYEAEGVVSANIEVTRVSPARPDDIILIGAHYDSVIGSPGANDNASGVAALLELSRLFARIDPQRTIRFVAFVNEEPPFFQTELMGSYVYARAARQRGDKIRFMVSLETMGFYSDEPGSQVYPPLFSLFYPDRGNFIGFVSNFGSWGSMRRLSRDFRAKSVFPLERLATFTFVPGVSWSDHWSFWEHDYDAMMVTDTAPYRDPHYHTADDTPDKLDYARLTRVTAGMFEAVRAFSEGRD